MGIKGLCKLLSDEAPDSIREVELKSLHGRKIALDASMAIYQFLIAVRSAGAGGAGQAVQLTNADGETTSHIQGMFNRTIRYMTEGIRPVFVFDGKPPSIKSGELAKRRDKRDKAVAAHKQAEEEGNIAELDKQSKRLVRAGHKENADCQKLLQFMGVPVVMAPCEAEAQAAALAKAGLVYAAATEDMDALTFATPILLRKMTFANASGSLVQSIDYNKALEGLQLTAAQFVDLCILLGCDYCDTIRGVGPKTALKLIREHGNIETILQKLDSNKYTIPDSWLPASQQRSTAASSSAPNNKPTQAADSETEDEERDFKAPPSSPINSSADDKKEEKSDQEQQVVQEEEEEETIPAYVQARKLFQEHEVLTDKNQIDLKAKPCQAEALLKYLVDDMGFNADRVKSSIEKLQAAYKANTKPQTRMDSFFTVKAKPATTTNTTKASAATKNATTGNKRKLGAAVTKGGSNNKKGKTASTAAKRR